MKSEEGIRTAWNLTASRAIHKKEKTGPPNPTTPPSLGADERKGYRFVPNAISAENKENMRLINKKVFGKGSLYSRSLDPTQEKRGEATHYEDGPCRVVYKMTKRHFKELCRHTYLDSVNKPKDREPYNVLLLMVWAFELEPNDIECIIDIMRHSGKALETGTSDTFEGVELWPNGGPQMWHGDTSPLDELYAEFISVGGADDEHKDIRRESTHFIICQDARYRYLASKKKKKRRDYLLTIWGKIHRLPRKQEKHRKGTNNIKYERQGDFEEKLIDGLKYIVFDSTNTSGTLFRTAVIHRAPQTFYHGFGIFLDWQGPFKDLNSDGLPVCIENYREMLSAQSEDDSNGGEDDGDDDEGDDDGNDEGGDDEDEVDGLPVSVANYPDESEGSSDDDDRYVVEYLSNYEEKLSQEENVIIRRFEKFWRKNSNPHTYSEDSMFGEPTAGTLSKITQAIVRHVGITKADKFGDWGAGQAKFFYGLNYFSPLRDLNCFGVEKDDKVWDNLQAILQKQPLPNAEWLHEKSENVTDWRGVTIVYNYDGPTKNDVELYHKQIMLNLFRLKTLKCLFSTKLDAQTFKYTFEDEGDFNAIKQQWALVRIPRLLFGIGSRQVGLCCHCSHCSHYHHCNHRMVC